jgi:hypothetical protein
MVYGERYMVEAVTRKGEVESGKPDVKHQERYEINR